MINLSKKHALAHIPKYYKRYLASVDEQTSIISLLQTQYKEAIAFYKNISEEKSTYKYAEDKWTIKDVLQHVIDTERIMAYRALRFARYDTQSILGFDENRYASNANANMRTWESLIKEFDLVRQTSIMMFEHFDENMYEQIGTANQKEISVIALAFVVVGHELHHREVLKERYL